MPGEIPEDIVAQILLGEAANQGPEGLEFVADVIFNRARAKGRSLESVATAPQQFSAYSRPDLAKFYSRQPLALQDLARFLVEERRKPDFKPRYQGVQHYVTRDFWNRRHEKSKSHWIHAMKPAFEVGSHVALVENTR